MVETRLELIYFNSRAQSLTTVLYTPPPERHRNAEGMYFLAETLFSFLALHH